MYRTRGRVTKALGVALLGGALVVPSGVVLTGGGAAAATAPAALEPLTRGAPVYTVHVILSGSTLTHTFTPSSGGAPMTETLSHPDDITQLDNDLFVGFQNGVGPQGEPSSDGNLDSTVVELKMDGDPVAEWDVQGKTDGVTADPETGLVIATVNEDANSSLYTIDPDAPGPAQVTHYSYNEALPHNGGTDAISIFRGQILISASAPGTSGPAAPQSTYPAVYSVRLNPSTMIATVTPLFYDEDPATVANVGSGYGQSTTLQLTDPDSNEVVPAGARFGGDFMLTSQGDQEQIFVRNSGWGHQSLAALSLSQSVDDSAWPTQSRGTLYSTDSTNDSIDTIRGPFTPFQPFAVATPCGANSAPATCPAPPAFPANYLATLDPGTGQVNAVTVVGAAYTPQGGLIFVPRGGHEPQ